MAQWMKIMRLMKERVNCASGNTIRYYAVRIVSFYLLNRHAQCLFFIATPCDENQVDLPPGAPPPPPPVQSPSDWTPYRDRVDFELTEFLYKKVQMSAGSIDILSQLIRASIIAHGTGPDDIDLFAHNNDLLATIDATLVGDVPWQGFSMSYEGPRPDEVPEWMTTSYNVWHRDPRQLLHNMLANRDFHGEFDYIPYREFDNMKRRRWRDFMSGDWAWKEADIIAQNPETHGAMLVPLVLGSDKTTVSVATGQNEYYPLYLSIGNVRNNVRRAHRNAVVVLGFLAIPKSKYVLVSQYSCHTNSFQRTNVIPMTRNSANSAGKCFTRLWPAYSAVFNWR